MCQADDGANCEDGVAPEGALHLGDGGEADLEAKAREIVENGPVIFGRESMAHYEAAILHALREERERAAKIAERLAYSNQATPYLGPELNCLRVAAAIRGDSNG